MADPGKRKLSAKQFLADIRSGLENAELKRKYDLSDKGLESVCTRLAATGALTEDQIRRLVPRRSSSETSPKVAKQTRWQCPACNTPQTAEMVECPVCGIVVEKFVARQGQAGDVSSADSGATPDTGQSERAGWIPVFISIAIFALVGSSLLLWSTYRAKHVPKVSEPGPGIQSWQQGGTETDQTHENIGESESTSQEYSEVEIVGSQDTMAPSAPVVVMPQEVPERTVVAPRDNTPTLPEKPQYVTGELRRFSSGNFKKEVVEASKTCPVLLQFYSDT